MTCLLIPSISRKVQTYHLHSRVALLNLKASRSRDLDDVLQVAQTASIQAGNIMKRTSGKIEISSIKANTADLVTESDIKCQEIIKEIIKERFPNDIFLGEEDVDAGTKASVQALDSALNLNENDKRDKLIWIVDPIDGTTNFQAGLPMFCCSIGVVSLEDGGPTVVAGVIYNPILDEMMSAVKGRGCYFNGDRVVINKDYDMLLKADEKCGVKLNEALVNVGFPVAGGDKTLEVSSKSIASLSTKVRGLRMIACASQVMCWVAQGKIDAYVSWDLNAWDIAAGMIIVEESGGILRNFDGTVADVSSRDMIVSRNERGSIHSLNEELRLVLAANGCLEY